MVTVENSTMSMPMKSSSEGVALSLWNKISEVQAAAEQCRIETRAAHEEYEKTQSSLDSLGHEEIEQVKATDDALQNAAEWSMRLHGGDGSKKSHCRSGGGVGAGGEGTQSTSPKSSPPLQRQWDRAQAEFTVALKVHREALHIGEQCKLYRQEQMRIAIEKSGRFRRQCHPLQHQVASIDATLIPFAATCAALGHATKDRSLFFNQANFSTTTVETPSEDENDPLTWVNFSGDPNDNQSALELLVQDYRWQQKAHTEAAHVLEQLESEQTQISMRCNQRQVRSHQLSLQLERLVADCDEVEMQTKHVQQMTIENQELARKFRCKINDRRSASDLAATRRVSFDAVPSRQQPVLTVASLPPPTIALSSTNEAQYNRGMGQHNKNVQNHNPYLATKRSLSDANRTAEPTTSRPRHELASIVVGPSRRTYRRDRQFGCSLEIPSSSTVGHDTANNESIQNTVSPNATSNSDPLTFDSTRKSFSGESIVGEADLEEPNDDADGLLSFVAFAAKRT